MNWARQERRQKTLAQMQTAMDALAEGVHYTDEQQRRAAENLGVERLLPDPEQPLPLEAQRAA